MAKKRFKKGSAAARSFMAKLRAMRKGAARKTRKSSRRRSRSLQPFFITEEKTMARKRRKARSHTLKERVFGRKRYSRKSTRRTYSRRRRSVRMHGKFLPSVRGFKPMAIIQEVGGIGAGAVGASFIAKLATKVPVLNNPNIVPFIPIILGILLPLTKFGKGKFVRDACSGAIAIGTIAAIKKFIPQLPLLSGEEVNEILLGMNGLGAEGPELLGATSDAMEPIESMLG